jgi:hypothetical protein
VNVAAIVAVAVLLSVGATLAWRAGGPPDAPRDPSTPVRLTVLAYLLLYGVGSLILLAIGESSGPGPLLTGVGLVGFGGGVWLASRVLGGMPPRARDSTTVPAAIHRTYRPWIMVALAAAGLAALAIIVAQHGVPLIARDPQASRAGFAGPLFDAFRWLVPPAALVALAVALSTGRARDRWVAAATLAGVAGTEIALASRALPLELAIEALLVAWWAGRRLSARAAAGLAAVALVLFVGIQLVRVGPEGGFSGAADVGAFAVRRTIDRVLLIHPRTLDLVATEIPAREPYFLGATYVRRLAILLGQEDRPSLGYWIYERLFPGEPGGFAAPGVLGEAWANGGPILAVTIMVVLGMLAQAIGRRLATLPRGPTSLVFAALVSVAIARSYATSLNGLLLTLAVATGWWLATTRRDASVEIPR